MNILLLNDTTDWDFNPGCNGTVSGIKQSLTILFPNSVILTKPIGYGYSLYNKFNFFIVRKRVIFPYFLFRYIVNRAEILKARIDDEESEIDLYVINMEGTIHHNTKGALVLLSLAYVLKKYGKKVWMLNGTIQDIDKYILNKSLRNIDLILLREDYSYQYLIRNNIKCVSGVDFVCNINIFEDNGIEIKPNSCMYTPGVILAYETGINGSVVVEKHLKTLKEYNYNIYFLQIEPNESKYYDLISEYGVEVIILKNENYKSIGRLLQKFELIITGRYHIALFALLSNVNTIALKSNTFKIEAMLDKMKFNCKILSIDDCLDDFIRASSTKRENENNDIDIRKINIEAMVGLF